MFIKRSRRVNLPPSPTPDQIGLTVELIEAEHASFWRSQPQPNSSFERNIVLAANILLSAKIFLKIKRYFELACLPFTFHRSYYNLQKDYLLEIANEAWLNEEKQVSSKI